jgi:DNA-binding winged helix-turn-helix (wHTH) protein/TolB-like protein
VNLHNGQIDLTREPDFVLGAISVHPSTREVETGSAREAIEPRVMQVLVALARRHGEVVSRDELIVSCWSGRAVSDDAINRCIARIRRLAETHGGFALETIPRIGYRLTETVPAVQEPPPIKSMPTPPPARPAAWRRRHLPAALAVLAVVAVSGLAYWLLQPAAKQPIPPAKFSIAVLPFTALAGDRDGQNLGEAIATSVADTLSSEGFEVVSPTRTRGYRAAAKADAPQALHADFVIDGEIRREGDVLKIPVRVIEASSGTILVADTVEAANAAAVPEIIASTVMNYGWGRTPGMKPSARQDARVIAGSLKAINFLANRQDNASAYEVAKQLAASAPEDAYAQMLYGEMAARFIPEVLPEHRMEVVLEARAAARKALRLDPEYGDAYGVLSAATPPFNWAVRERYLRRGLRIRPMSPLAYMSWVEFLQNAGYTRYGAVLAEEAYTRHPAIGETLVKLINARLLLGDAAAARPLIARGRKLYPKSTWFAVKMFEATAFYGSVSDAEALLQDPATASLLQAEGNIFGHIVTALRHGRTADVQTVADDCAVVLRRTPEFKRTCLLALARLGRLNEAFRMVDSLYPDQRGADQAEVERRWLPIIPFATAYLFAPPTAVLRSDPRFRDVIERVGLLQYWKANRQPPDVCAVERAPVCSLLKT